jgi:hypothetical protein
MMAAAAAPATAMKMPATLPIIVGAAALELVVRAALADFELLGLVSSLPPAEVGEPLLSPVWVASSLPAEASGPEVSSELAESDVLVLWAVVVVAKREAVRQ